MNTLIEKQPIDFGLLILSVTEGYLGYWAYYVLDPGELTNMELSIHKYLNRQEILSPILVSEGHNKDEFKNFLRDIIANERKYPVFNPFWIKTISTYKTAIIQVNLVKEIH